MAEETGCCRGAIASGWRELWRKKKNRSRFELLDVADHTFYHFNVNAAYFEQLLNSWSSFMVEQGIWEYNEGMDAGIAGLTGEYRP